jgi:hypothetical protein
MKTCSSLRHAVFCPVLFVAACLGASSAHAAVIAQYHFDEASGPTAFDSAGSFNGTLSLTGSSFVGGGISGNAISLNQGLGGLVNMGSSFPAFATGDFSIVAWVNTTTTAADTLVLSKHKAGTQNGYLFAINTTGGGGVANKATFTVGSENVSQSPTSTSSVNDGTWHQIVGVYQAGGIHSIYVDGAPVEAFTLSAGVPDLGAPFLIGGVREIAGTNNPESRYTGLIDEVQVYNQTLSDSDITYLFQNPTQVVPEPGALALLATGCVGWLASRRTRRNA